MSNYTNVDENMPNFYEFRPNFAIKWYKIVSFNNKNPPKRSFEVQKVYNFCE